MYFPFSLQELSKPVHHISLMLHQRMGVTIERDGRVFMPEDLGKRFYIYTALNGSGGERMPQGMKTLVRYLQFFEEQLKTSLIGADGNGLSVT